MKYLGVALLSVVATIISLYLLKSMRAKAPEDQLQKDIIALLDTPQFKALRKSKAAKDIVKTPEFIELSINFGSDLILSQLGI